MLRTDHGAGMGVADDPGMIETQATAATGGGRGETAVPPAVEARPFHGSARLLYPDEHLALPMARRMVCQHTGSAAVPELTLFYDDKEIAFDEPHLFPFAETLARQDVFRAGEAGEWAPGCDWDVVAPLLAQLLDEGILVRAADATRPAGPDACRRERPSPLPPAPAASARDWRDCAAITRELTGIAVDPAHLELVIPVFRVAHVAVDGDGRQVGEANVFPRALRIEAGTEWLACTYAGTRYLSDRPMNATALKAMRAHWPQMMAALVAIRRAFLRRFPAAAAGMTVGDIERLAVMVLSVPTYSLVKRDAPVANGALHPALSSLFRVTDGLRMVMHQMLFVPIGEPALPPDAPMTADRIHAYAERNYSFHSETGVCAGPRILVDQFLHVLVEGTLPEGAETFTLDPEVAEALTHIEEAFDYGLLGLQVHAAFFLLWPRMAALYGDLATLAAEAVAAGADGLNAARGRFAACAIAVETTTYLGKDHWRSARDLVYADMFERCGQACRSVDGTVTLAHELARLRQADRDATANRLQGMISESRGVPADQTAAIARRLADFLGDAQAILAVADDRQARVSRHLGRAPALRPFTSAEADVHNLLQGAAARRVPYIFDEIEALFGIAIRIAPAGIAIGWADDGASCLSTDALSAGPCAWRNHGERP